MNEGGENTNSMSKEIESDIVAIVTCIGKVKFYIALLKSLLWASWCCYELKSYIANLSAIEYFEIKKTVLPFVTSFLVLLPFFFLQKRKRKKQYSNTRFSVMVWICWCAANTYYIATFVPMNIKIPTHKTLSQFTIWFIFVLTCQKVSVRYSNFLSSFPCRYLYAMWLCVHIFCEM